MKDRLSSTDRANAEQDLRATSDSIRADARRLDAIEAQCRALGLETLRLGVYDKNARAIAFYRRAGFAVAGTATFAVGQDIQSDLIMEKSLTLS